MKYAIISDTHFEFYNQKDQDEFVDKLNQSEADMILLIGDIHSSPQGLMAFLSRLQKPSRFVYGNHDYYSLTKEHVLETSKVIDQDNIISCTLWTDFNGSNSGLMNLCQIQINDFRLIKDFKPIDAAEIYYQQVKEIFDSPSEIVLTHFPPSLQLLNPRYPFYDPLNRYFHNDLDELIKKSNKKLWVYGHNHYNHDIMIGNCRVISNQLGYPKEYVENFKIVKIVEI